MTAMTWTAARAALAVRLQTVTTWNVYEQMPPAANFPAVIIEGFEKAEQDSLGYGGFRWDVVVTVYVGLANYTAAQDALDAYASPDVGGIWYAVQNDAATDDLHAANVRELRNYGEYEVSIGTVLGFQALIELHG